MPSSARSSACHRRHRQLRCRHPRFGAESGQCELRRQRARLAAFEREEHGIDTAFLLRRGLQCSGHVAGLFGDGECVGHAAAATEQLFAERIRRAAHAVVIVAEHQDPAGVAGEQEFRGGDAVVLRRQRKACAAAGRGDVAAVEREHRHAQLAAEQRTDLIATQWAEHVVGTGGDGIAVGGDRTAGSASGVVEHDLRATTLLAVVTGQQAVAHWRGGSGEAAGERQQHGELLRRAIAVAVRRRAVAGIELPIAAAIERTWQRQSAIEQRASGEVVERFACREGGCLASQCGVVEPGEQAFDPLRVVDLRLAAEGGIHAREFGGAGEGGAHRGRTGAADWLTGSVLQPAASTATSSTTASALTLSAAWICPKPGG